MYAQQKQYSINHGECKKLCNNWQLYRKNFGEFLLTDSGKQRLETNAFKVW